MFLNQMDASGWLLFDALMRRVIHLRGPFPIVIGGTGRVAVEMLPEQSIASVCYND
jgi:hypothetical protein